MSAGKVVPLTCHGHSRPVTHLEFSPLVEDEQYYMISSCKDNNPMLRNGITGDWIGTFLGHKGAVWQSRLSLNSLMAVTGSADFTSKIWDTTTGDCLYTMQHNHIVKAVAFEPSKQPSMIATGGYEKKLRLYDISDQAAAAAAPNGSTAQNGQPSNESNGITSAPSYEIGPGAHSSTIKSIVWGPQPTQIITATEDGNVRFFDIRVKDAVHHHKLDGSIGTCEMTHGPKGTDGYQSLLAVSAGKTAYFYNGEDPRSLVKTMKVPYEIASLTANLQENVIVTGGGSDTWVKCYSWSDNPSTDGTCTDTLQVYKGHHGPVWSLAFSPDGRICASGSEDGTIKLWKFGASPYGLWQVSAEPRDVE